MRVRESQLHLEVLPSDCEVASNWSSERMDVITLCGEAKIRLQHAFGEQSADVINPSVPGTFEHFGSHTAVTKCFVNLLNTLSRSPLRAESRYAFRNFRKVDLVGTLVRARAI